jgi:16S rRNA (adenine1518-N6/adenine1519-N6)-dimethyltransferase
VAAVGARSGDALVEIGGGNGEITLPIARTGARVLTLESDPRLAERLRRRLAEQADGRLASAVEILEADASRVSFPALLDQRGLSRVRVFGNLPYSVAAPILLNLLSTPERFDDLTLMFQNEVAQRLVAKPGTKAYGFLSVIAQQAADVKLLFRLPADAFRPRPRVVSALVRLELRHQDAPEVGEVEVFRALVRGLLTHRRKTIGNNIKYLRAPSGQGRGQKLARAVSELGLDPQRRAETLSVEEFASLSRICASPS